MVLILKIARFLSSMNDAFNEAGRARSGTSQASVCAGRMSRRFDRLSCANGAWIAFRPLICFVLPREPASAGEAPFPRQASPTVQFEKSVPYIFTSSAGSRWISTPIVSAFGFGAEPPLNIDAALKGTATRHDYARERQHAIGFTFPIIRKQFLVS